MPFKHPNAIILDADILVYRACASVEHEVRYDDNIHVLYSNLADAKERFLESTDQFGGYEEIAFAFSDDNNWRYSVDPTYKSNRKNVRRPMAMQELKQWVKNTYDYYQWQNLEADDVIGVLVSSGQYICWSPDKDLKQVPGWHLQDKTEVYVSPEQGYRFHMYQTLVGDVADGYKGCPGVGPVKAEKLLNAELPDEWFNSVQEAYVRAGLTYEDALRTAQIAKILTNKEYDTKTEEIKLWQPS